MRTNIDIDEKLLLKIMRSGSFTSKKSAVETALLNLIRHYQQRKILKLSGTIEFDPSYNYKEMRNSRYSL